MTQDGHHEADTLLHKSEASDGRKRLKAEGNGVSDIDTPRLRRYSEAQRGKGVVPSL